MTQAMVVLYVRIYTFTVPVNSDSIVLRPCICQSCQVECSQTDQNLWATRQLLCLSQLYMKYENVPSNTCYQQQRHQLKNYNLDSMYLKYTVAVC